MKDSDFVRGEKIDLTNCDREPIHIPGAVQPHGVLIVVDEPDLTIRQISVNAAENFGLATEKLLGKPLGDLLAPEDLSFLKDKILTQNLEANPTYLPPMQIDDKWFEPIAHRFKGATILEFERQTDEAREQTGVSLASLRAKINELNRLDSLKSFCDRAAEIVREFTGFDRVMVYRFLDDGAGHIFAEAFRDDLESYLGLHYPAADIPQQARRLFVLNPIRVLPDVDAGQVPLVRAAETSEEPLDMSHTTIRAVSPIHLEYLRNMGVRASMSISIVKDGALWGMFACHHYTPRPVPHAARTATEFLAHLLSLQVNAKESTENYEYRARLKDAQTALIEHASNGDGIVGGLFGEEHNLLSEIEAGGAALILGDEVHTIGVTPNEEQLRELAVWLWKNQPNEIYASSGLSQVYPPAEVCRDCASGVLAARLTRHKPEYLLWFRGEHAHTVNWAGNPDKPVEVGEFGDRLTPRKSFALWQQSVSGKSKQWLACEIEHATALRHWLVEIIIRHAEKLQRINEELERSNVELDSFAYIASHDLKEPLRGIHNYSHFLIEEYADKLDADAQEKLQTLMRLTQRMESLIESLLQYSRVGRAQLELKEIDLNELVRETLEMISSRISESNTEIRFQNNLPAVLGDEDLLREVLTNLITNAVKYNDKENRWIEIGRTETEPRAFFVRDNGIGISDNHFETVFRIFKRLHNREAFGGGVGVGLTITKKIIERHGGQIWLESEPQIGTTFYFTLDAAEAAAATL